jgi:hypothetical protein
MIPRFILISTLTLAAMAAQPEERLATKLTPIILVDTIEPCLDFWTELGFERTAEVPIDGALGFVSLQMGQVEIMYQSRASVIEGIPALAQGSLERSGVALFVEVDDLEPPETGAERRGVDLPRAGDILRHERNRRLVPLRYRSHLRPAARPIRNSKHFKFLVKCST